MREKISPPDEPTTIETSDLALGSWLLCRGAELIATNRRGGRVYWTFRSAAVEALRNGFINNSMCRIQNFLTAQRNLRSTTKGGEL